jgi:LPXTG-motif cell wall-anchored protein
MDITLWLMLAAAAVGAGGFWYSWKRRQANKK